MKSILTLFFISSTLAADDVSLQYFDATTTDDDGASYVTLLDIARRMLSGGDTEFQSISGTFDSTYFGITEGADWAGNIWTQNTYGFGFSSPPLLNTASLNHLRRSFLWWYNNAGDGAQHYGGLHDVPAGMLCDNGHPEGCNYMQCGAGRGDPTTPHRYTAPNPNPNLKDTAALGHDFIIEGTLAGTIQQAEILLATRNISGARDFFLPIMKQTSDFLETRRVQDASPLTPGAAGLFFAGNGANLLAPAFAGQGLPSGCLSNSSCGSDGFPDCCSQYGFSYPSGLTITYSGVLDRLIALEEMVYGANETSDHICTSNMFNDTKDITCGGVYKARRKNNDDSIGALLVNMASSNTSYLLKSLSPDGEKHGVYSPPSVTCEQDQPCPPETRHGYFETSPNVDAIALNVVDEEMKSNFYDSMLAVDGIRPCAFTVPNFPDYDDTSCSGEASPCYGYGTWVSGGSWSTLEGRVIMAHIDQRRYDLAAASMGRLVYPYASLFKMDNPIAHMGCGPGMYSQDGAKPGGGDNTGAQLTLDVFGIPAGFLRGLMKYEYKGSAMKLTPRLPSGIEMLKQKFPVRWGEVELFLSLVRGGGGGRH